VCQSTAEETDDEASRRRGGNPPRRMAGRLLGAMLGRARKREDSASGRLKALEAAQDPIALAGESIRR
jgi:hypothetical protein